MSFIREPCDDGTHCYNNIAQSSFGTECIQDADADADANDKVCKVLTGNMCNHDVDCAVDSDRCVDQKCTTTQCNCASYQDCVDYECKSKPCSSTPNCLIEDASRSSGGSGSASGGRSDAAFCFDNYCRPLASFGGQCGISSDCGEKKASCIGGICAAVAVAEKAKGAAIQKEASDADGEDSSFGTGFIAGFLAASFIGFGIYFEYKTQSISECLRNGRRNIHTGMVAVPAVAVELEGEVVSATSKQIQLSAIT
jgi:hypothetical protein